MKKTKLMKFRLYSYDLVGDEEGYLSVNDVYRQHIVEIRARLKILNEGTPHEWSTYDITDRQLNRAVGGHGLTWDGELDYVLYATDKKGNPACELRRLDEGEKS